jgi:predicted nucleic acid-binding Zn ribbon protein
MSINIVPGEENYCVVCDNRMTTSNEFDQVCSNECQVIFADFSVVYSCKSCLYCCREMAIESENDFCSDDCFDSHEESEYLRTHCIYCYNKMEEPIKGNVCSELCDTKFALERYLEEEERYIESKRQEYMDDNGED